jgi:hypothetical protein
VRITLRAAIVAALLALLVAGCDTNAPPAAAPSATPAVAAAPAPDREANVYSDQLEQTDEASHGHERLEDLAGVPESIERSSERANDHLAETYDTSRILNGATPQPTRGSCASPNHHARGGKQVLLDLFGVGDYLARPSTKASATWIVDNEANSCTGVPLSRCPWTQAYWNCWSASIENVGYAAPAKAQWTDLQLREGARLFVRAGILPQRGKVDLATGRILKPGVVTHKELGQRGGGHVDPGPRFDMARFMHWMRYYHRALVGPSAKARNDAATACRKLNWHRRRANRDGHWSRARGARARQLKRTIRRGRLACPA